MVARSGDFSVIERLGDVHPTFAVVGSLDDDLKAVCKAALEIERLRKARIVFGRYGIDYLGVRRSIDRKVVVKEIFIQPRLVRKLQIAARADGSIVHEQAIPVALRGRDVSPQRQGRRIALHLDEQFAHHVVCAVAADRIFRVRVIDVERIAADTGVDLAVAKDRNREPVMYVGPDIEIRGVVIAQVNVIGQYLSSPYSPDQKIRRIRGGIVRILIALVGNGRNRALHIRKQIAVPRNMLSRNPAFRAVRVVVGGVRRPGRHVEDRHRTRHGTKLHGAKLDVCGFDGDIVGYLRHDTLHLHDRKCQNTAGRGRDRNVALIGHRQRIVLVGVRNGEVFRCGILTKVTAHIGGDTHPVVAGQGREAQRRRALVAVQDDLAVIVIEIEVQVAERLFVRSAGYGRHRVGTYCQPNRNAAGMRACRPVFGDAAHKGRGKTYRQDI